jgi:ribosomal-protein-alanine N-acetyltransferase
MIAGKEPALVVEPMRLDDLGQVMAIEIASFSLPWTREMFEGDLAREDLATMLVARLPGRAVPPPIAGYICMYHVTDELHINNLAVDPRWRRQGVARALLQAGLEHGRRIRARRAMLEVRVSNVAAQGLYRAFGFETAGIRRRYYAQPAEDALVMECRMTVPGSRV